MTKKQALATIRAALIYGHGEQETDKLLAAALNPATVELPESTPAAEPLSRSRQRQQAEMRRGEVAGGEQREADELPENCEGEDCMKCSGEYCARHPNDGCDCDVLDRHYSEDDDSIPPPAVEQPKKEQAWGGKGDIADFLEWLTDPEWLGDQKFPVYREASVIVQRVQSAISAATADLQAKVERLEGEREQMKSDWAGEVHRFREKLRTLEARRFPIQGGPSVPLSVMLPYDSMAHKNHGGQSLERLAQRGGLCPVEAIAVVTGRKWRDIKEADYPAMRAEWAAFAEKQNGLAAEVARLKKLVTNSDGFEIDCVALERLVHEANAGLRARAEAAESQLTSLQSQLAAKDEEPMPDHS